MRKNMLWVIPDMKMSEGLDWKIFSVCIFASKTESVDRVSMFLEKVVNASMYAVQKLLYLMDS